MIAVLQYKNTDNPLGIPGDYPAQTRPLRDGEEVDAPWVEMTEHELGALSESLLPQVKAIFDARSATEKSNDAQKLGALRVLFDKCDATAAIWGSATRAQKDDFLEDFYKIIRRQKRQILDQYRPE
jgi:hypothetical protein